MQPQFNPTSPKLERKKDQLVSQNCLGQLYCYFWLYLSHFKSDFDGIKEQINLLIQYIPTIVLTIQLATSQSPKNAVASYFASFLNPIKHRVRQVAISQGGVQSARSLIGLSRHLIRPFLGHHTPLYSVGVYYGASRKKIFKKS